MRLDKEMGKTVSYDKIVCVNEASNSDYKEKKTKEERKMDYKTLVQLMNDTYCEKKDRMGFDDEYEIVDYYETVEVVANEFRFDYCLDYLCSLEEAEQIYDEYLSAMSYYKSFRKMVAGCKGDLKKLGEELYNGFYLGIESDSSLLEGYIFEWDLADVLADYGFIEYERENLTIEDLFVEFCAFHNLYMEDRSDRTIESYLKLFNYSSQELKNTCLKDINPQNMEEFIKNDLLKQDMKITRFRQVIAFYNQLFKYVEEYGICRHPNPMEYIDIALIENSYYKKLAV